MISSKKLYLKWLNAMVKTSYMLWVYLQMLCPVQNWKYYTTLHQLWNWVFSTREWEGRKWNTSIAFHYLEPVSYTHLDVYKRQPHLLTCYPQNPQSLAQSMPDPQPICFPFYESWAAFSKYWAHTLSHSMLTNHIVKLKNYLLGFIQNLKNSK